MMERASDLAAGGAEVKAGCERAYLVTKELDAPRKIDAALKVLSR